jgi:pectinesterase
VYICCNLGKHIALEGWNNWNKKDAEKTVTYAEYQSTGDGASASTRAKFSKQLKNLKGYDMNEVLGGTDGWNPAENGNALLEIKR